MTRTVYISGPMRGLPLYNFPAFFEAEKYCREFMRKEPLNPARGDMEVGFNPFADVPTDEQIEKWFARDLLWVEDADDVWLLTGWQDSVGAKKELEHYLQTHDKWRVYLYDAEQPENYRLKDVPRERLHQFDTKPEPEDELDELIRKSGEAAKVLLGPKEGAPIAREHFPEFPRILIEGPDGAGTEVRTTSSTGGQKGVKPARFDLIPIGPLTELAKLYGYGATKYADRNWEKGYEFSKSYAALMRHLTQWWEGEDVDPEHFLSHLSSVVFHAFAMMEWINTHPEFDDRPKPPLEEIQNGVYQPRWADSPDAHPVL